MILKRNKLFLNWIQGVFRICLELIVNNKDLNFFNSLIYSWKILELDFIIKYRITIGSKQRFKISSTKT